MTVEVYDWCGDEARRSTKYAVTANGTSAHVYRKSQTAFFTVGWSEGATVEVSCLTVGADQDVTFAITRLVGSITSYTIYGLATVTASLASGTLTVVAPLGAKLHIETNGERQNPLILACNPLATSTAGFTPFDSGSPPAAFAAGERWIFEAGEVYNVGHLFPVASDVQIYVQGGAVVNGNWDLRNAGGVDDINFVGAGLLVYEDITYAAVAALPTFADRLLHSLFVGHDGVNFEFGNVTVAGLTLLGRPYFLAYDPINHWEDVVAINPWTLESNGLSCAGDAQDGFLGTMTRCYSWAGDDNCHLGDAFGDREIEECFFVNTNAAAFYCGYWPNQSDEFYRHVDGCMAMMFNSEFTVIDSVIRSWVDGPVGYTGGQFNYRFRNLRVVGPLAIRVLQLENSFYLWGDTEARAGKFVNWLFETFTVDELPEDDDHKSQILGLDYDNLPINIAFRNTRFGGTLLTQRNFSDFIEINQFRSGLSFGGRTVVTAVDICNSALSFIGERDRVTAIAPVDGSEEARQCARAFPEAFDELMEMHNWSFNTKKIQLTVVNALSEDTDDPAWAYRYVIPEGMAEALAVLVDDHTEDYVIGATKQPQNFHIKLSTTDAELRLYTNTPDAWLRYTVYHTDPNQLSRLAITALTWLVASKLAGTIVRGDSGEAMKNRCLATFGKYLAEAKLKDAKQRQVDARADAPWLAGRNTRANPWNVSG